MTAPRDPDRIIGAYFQDGPAELSPRLAQAIRDDLRRTDQRAPRRSWRFPAMPRPVLILIPLAAVVLLAGALLLAGGGQPSRTSTVASPAASAVVVAPVTAPPATPSPTASTYPIGAGEQWIVFEGPSNHVALIRPDGTGMHLLLNEPDQNQATPDWSPDGSRIVFTRDYGYGSQLWVTDADGSNGTALTALDDRCAPQCSFTEWARWSPDGTRIAYIDHATDVGGRTTAFGLVILDLATGETHRLYETTGEGLHMPTWSPDGTQIAIQLDHYASGLISGRPDASTVAIIDLEAAEPVPVPIPGIPALAGHPDWSADGRTIVFRTNPWVDGVPLDATQGTTIGVISPTGGDARTVLDSPVGGRTLRATAWTPDGRILYAPLDPLTESPTLRIVNADGSGDGLATGTVVTDGGEPRLRPVP
jgi:dipeptidyl aminopeptidase/acylaminoacyl peptidase